MKLEDFRDKQAGAAASEEELRAALEREFRVIGRRLRRTDGLAKSTGRAVYTDDIALPGMLHGKILRSPHPHARIKSIDASKALAREGVHAVVTGHDMPVPYGIIPWTRDEYPLCLDKARYVGDGVAAVAAVDEDTANEALELIDVVYEPLPHYLDPEEALAHPETPIHEPRKAGENGNVSKHVHLAFGEVDELMAESDVVIEGEYYFEGTTHTAIEPHCAIGYFDPAGKLTVWSATQVPHYLHRELARVLELDVAKVRVIQPPIGGAFGGKSEPFDLEFCVAKLSMMTGRPVKILYTREEVFYAHRGRHPMLMRYKTGAAKNGRIKAVDARTVIDGGGYSSFGLVTTYYSGQLITAPYQMESYRFDSTRVYTNKPCCGPKRGHGSVQPRFALEVQLDKIADALEIDPIELRRRNLLGSNSRTVNEFRVTSNGFLQCLDAVEQASGWQKKYRKLPYGRGVGVAGSCYISGTNYPIYPNEMPQSAVQLQVDRSGRVAVFCGASEIGQGSDSMLAYIVSEELGVPLDYVRILSSDTDLTPVDLGAYSSRVTFMCGNACIDAARKIKKQVREAVAEAWECKTEAGDARGRLGLQRDGHRPKDADLPGVQSRRGEVRNAGRDRILQHAEEHSRRLPGRHDRRIAGLLVHRPRRRSRGRPRHGLRRGRSRSGSPTTAGGRSTPCWSRARWKARPTWASPRRSWRSTYSRRRGCTTRRRCSTTRSPPRWTHRRWSR